jgi:hypothetical protein
MPQPLHLQPGDTVDLAHLRRRVTLADDLTLGAMGESLERMEPGQRSALEAILGDPLAPWLDDCRRARPPDDRTGNGLIEIRLRWRCCSSVAPPGHPPRRRGSGSTSTASARFGGVSGRESCTPVRV